MPTLLIETDAPTNILHGFVDAAKEHGFLSTGWTNTVRNPLIEIQGIEISDLGPMNG